MKIALISPVFYPIPAIKYGGVESVVYNLASGLGRKKHEVYVLASGDSAPSPDYKIIPVTSKSVIASPEIDGDIKKREVHTYMAIAEALKHLQKEDYDIIHNHNDWKFLSFAQLLKKPLVTTHHNSLHYPFKKTVFEYHKNLPHISISYSQRKLLPDINWFGNVYNSVDTNSYTYNESPGENMVFLARMSNNKGAIEAAQTAKITQKTIDIITRIDVGSEELYYEQFKKTIDKKYVHITEEIELEEKNNFLRNAKCLIAPINWEEPFGLYMIEAMSCGTPVIAFSRGSVPEIIRDGETGFIVNHDDNDIRGDWLVKKTGINGLSEAVERLYALPDNDYKKMRLAARKYIETHFTIEQMASKYEALYQKLLQ